jgi:hypothetical protein
LFRTFSKGADGVHQAKLAPVSELTSTDGLRLDLAPVHDDIITGAPARATVVGPARAIAAGQRVIVAGSASAPGVVSLEVSSDGGATWALDDSDTIPAGEHLIGLAEVPQGTTHYHVSFTAGDTAASRVHLSTQARP